MTSGDRLPGASAMKRKIVISAGGTGGHLFPALALAHHLRADGDADLCFLGGGLSSNRYFDRTDFNFREIPCGSFVNKSPLSLARNGYDIARGVGASFSFLREHRPDVVVGFGSFYGFPPLIATRMLGIPLVLYAADVIPGRVIRWIAPYATVTGTHFVTTAAMISGTAVPVDMPLRHTLANDRCDAAQARRYFGLDPATQTFLVFGGSQGAQRLNEMLLSGISELKKQATKPFQIIHFTGTSSMVTSLTEAYQRENIPACVKVFEERMGLAWSAADLALGRSGAGTIAEMFHFKVPCILVPYPYATDAHQDKNADAVVSLGVALKLIQSHITPTSLAKHIAQLLNDTYGRRTAMRQSLCRAAIDTPKQTLANLVWETLNNTKAR